MRVADAVVMVCVGALGLFVGSQVVRHPPPAVRTIVAAARPAAPAPVAQQGTAAPLADRQIDARTSIVTGGATTDRPSTATRDLEDIRARIAGATDTYMADMLVDLNGGLVRWPERRDGGLRVWVQSMTTVRDWDLRYAQMARDAFADWSGDGFPLRFDFVLDSASSDVQIVWTDRFPPEAGARVGTTNRKSDQYGWIVGAEIAVAVHDSSGRTIPPSALAGIVRHEAGHALGLGHSRDPKTKMFPVEMVTAISPADRATLRLLYQLPPGVVR